MRKRIISFTLTFLMLFLLIPTPVLGYDTTIPVYVCGIKVSDGGYWLNNGSGGITSTNADSNNYNVKYDYNTKKLTLKNANLNYSNDNTIYSATVYGGIALDIVLEGTNSVISTSAMDAAINTIYSGDIRIQGEGSLTAVGEYSGIYAFENIFIEGGTINVSGKTYGIESNRRDIYIINGNLTTSSTNSAMAKAPVFTDYEYLQITGSALKTDGTSTNTITLEELKSNLKTYKYIKFEPTVDAPKKAKVKISFSDAGGYTIKSPEFIWMKEGDELIAPNINGYKPFTFSSYSATFLGGTTGMYNINYIGTFENPIGSATIENISFENSNLEIDIQYTEKDYEVSGIIKDSKTNTGIKASLLLRDENGAEIGETVANENGEYTFKGIKSGVYKIDVSCEDYIDGVIENIVVTNENIVNNEIALKPEKMETTIKYVDNKGNDIKVSEKKDIKVFDTVNAPNIEGYTPYMITGYGVSFVGGSSGVDNSNSLGSKISPISIATIENIDFTYDPIMVIYYTKNTYEIMGIIKDIKTNSGIEGKLKLKDEDGNLISETVANIDGEYKFTDINPGTYKIEVSFIGYEDGVIENITVINENIVNNEITLKPDLPTDKPMQIKPEIIEGANQVILEGAEGKFRSNANINEFVKVLLDNMEVSPDNYLLKEGSIIIILKSDYIKSLDAGKHTLSIISTNGSADTEFTVAKNEDTTVVEDKKITNELKDNPKTGDNFNLFLIYSMLSLITISGVIKKKKFYNR